MASYSLGARCCTEAVGLGLVIILGRLSQAQATAGSTSGLCNSSHRRLQQLESNSFSACWLSADTSPCVHQQAALGVR